MALTRKYLNLSDDRTIHPARNVDQYILWKVLFAHTSKLVLVL